MRVNCVDRVQFDRLYVRFSLPHYNPHCLVENRSSSRLEFEPNRIYTFRFRFMPLHDDIGKELEVSSLSLELGSRETRVLVMHWRGDCRNALANENQTIVSTTRPVPRSNEADQVMWDEIMVAPITRFVCTAYV